MCKREQMLLSHRHNATKPVCTHWYYAHEEEEFTPDNRATFVGSCAIQPVKLLMPVIKAVQSVWMMGN